MARNFNVTIEQMSLFLTREGKISKKYSCITSNYENDAKCFAKIQIMIEFLSSFLLFCFFIDTVITFFPRGGEIVTIPLFLRLNDELGVARTSCDTTFLVDSIIDAIVDHSKISKYFFFSFHFFFCFCQC